MLRSAPWLAPLLRFLLALGLAAPAAAQSGNRLETLRSRVLGRRVRIALHVPAPESAARWRATHGDGPLALVLFLPGAFDSPEDLLSRGIYGDLSRREGEGGLAPSLWVAVEHFQSWYADRKDGRFPYERFLREELLPGMEARFPGFGGDPAHRAVAGLSMGGFGALNLAGRTSLFTRCAALSPALVEPPFGTVNWWLRRSLNRAFAQETDAFEPWNPWAHLGGTIDLALGCGLDDKYGLANATRGFADLRTRAGHPPLRTDLRPGGHDWGYWAPAFLALAPWLAGTPGAAP